jgi:ABC-2 type transport system permease protein
VFGDSDFAANGFLGVEGNSDLFLNAVNWLAGQDNLISVRPRDAADRRITMTPDRTRITVLFSVLFLPMLFIGAGIVTWWRRR